MEQGLHDLFQVQNHKKNTNNSEAETMAAMLCTCIASAGRGPNPGRRVSPRFSKTGRMPSRTTVERSVQFEQML